MSERASRWARELTATPTGAPLTGQEAHLLLLLASYHSEVAESGYWPHVKQLAAALRVSDRRTQQVLDKLEAKGCITRDHRGGRGHSTEYTLSLPLKGEMGEPQSTPFEGIVKGERVKDSEIKGETLKGERVKPIASPFGGTIGGSTPEYPGDVPSLPEVSTKLPPETAAAAGAGVQEMVSVLLRQPGFETDPKFLAKVAAKYGHLDLEEEAIKMVAWLKTPTAKRKKRTCTPAFVLNWLSGVSGPSPPPAANVNGSRRAREGPRNDFARTGSPDGQPRQPSSTLADLEAFGRRS